MVQKILEVPIEEEMKKSYLSYALSVIISRALPDVRDGLKPVQRRILYTMYELGLKHNKPFKKSARIVGETMGKYHPHGDSSIYEAMVRMAQDFSLNHPLIEGHGNFGSIDGDPQAAMRYTEARLSEEGELMLEDIEKECVPFVPNFDGTLKEPEVLPSKFPNLLVNGTMGIAVGMATNIPPHNLREVVDALIHLIQNPNAEIKEMMNYLKGPDFPTGGEIYGDLEKIYKTGKGIIKIRGKYRFEKNGKIITFYEIPYQTNKSKIVSQIADLIQNKKIEKVSDLRDESSKEGIRLVLELRKGANVEYILNQIFKNTDLEISYGINLLAVHNKVPVHMNLKEMMQYYLDHRLNVITKRTEYLLNLAKKRQHILEGLLIALNDIDNVVEMIKNSENREMAKNKLIKNYNLSEEQADNILNMSLGKLTSLETNKLIEEKKEIDKKVKEYENILKDDNVKKEILINELIEIKEKFGKERKTEIKGKDTKLISKEDLIKKEDVIVFYGKFGYFIYPKEDFINKANRGTLKSLFKGKNGIFDICLANTMDEVLIITSQGKVYKYLLYELDEKLSLDKEEDIIYMSKIDKNIKELCLLTRKGIVKRVSFDEILKSRNSSKIIRLDDDYVVSATRIKNEKNIIVITRIGYAVKISLEDIRISKKGSGGVNAINLSEEDYAIKISSSEKYLITLTDENRLNCIETKDIPLMKRGSKGKKIIKFGTLKQVINSNTTKVICIFENGDVLVEDIGLGMPGVKGVKLKEPVKYIVRYIEG